MRASLAKSAALHWGISMANFKNVRPMGTPEGRRNPLRVPSTKIPGKGKFLEARINKGMITTLDPADIEPSALQKARNARCRFDRTLRRPGTILLPYAKPNTDAVVGMGYHKTNTNVKYVMRFASGNIHYLTSSAWTEVTAGTGDLNGTDQDRFRGLTAFDRYFFTNNGVDPIQEVDFSVPEYNLVGNAPRYKYIVGFYNRIVGANYNESPADPTRIGWSGDLNLEEWDPLVDETAGFSPLVDSPSDRADFITGLFAFTNVMGVLRERSIWLATKQPIPQNPFYFYTAFPGLGCDTPNSVAVGLNGVMWLDTRSGTVWFYTPGGEPQPIGRPIEKELISGLSDQSLVYGSFNPIEHEYSVAVPQGSSWTKLWTYNFRTQSWVYDEYSGISSMSDVDFAVPTITIDDLGDVPINQLIGTIDGLSPDREDVPVRMFGRFDGEITQEDPQSYTDPVYTDPSGPVIGPPLPGYEDVGYFQTELVSKSFAIPTDDMYICEINLEFTPKAGGEVTLMYSKDGGATFKTASKIKTFGSADIGVPQQFRWVKHIKCRKFAWKLLAHSGQWDLTSYTVYVYQGAESAA